MDVGFGTLLFWLCRDWYLVVTVIVRCCFGVGVLLGLGWLRLALLLCMIFGGLFDLVELG